MATETFLASFGLVGLRLIERHGIDPAHFARELGIPSTALPDARTRLPSALLDSAFEKAARCIPDPAFALGAAECWHPSHLGTLGYAWLSSGSLRTALKRMARYTKTLGQRMSSRCVETPEGLQFIYDHGRGDTLTGWVMADFGLSLIVSLCRTNDGTDLAPALVTLRRPTPATIRPYEDFFGGPVRFGETHDGLLLSWQVADRPLPTSNRELATTCDAILASELATLQNDDLESRCRAHLLHELTSGEPSDTRLAESLGLSTRTLQRKLAALGLSYRGLLEKTRYELALRYLDDPKKSVTEITFLLGFSEQSAFTRAFKRWNGKAPSDYRQSPGS
ncbi:AraC family transcriptional regulator [Zoogloea sp.]|uniref:AraC family transcriptional regulator n=1 Tax=Zoogloea sp. TaxID=49181 RepID=UPI001B6A511B|nr:AraC family transcriptional regulator [Zoogloea sp.]MBK6655962.1 AraC family transcriptional regulator [Zoogloea sp.]MBP7444154.1 AraC family transcriptional regulator [Zoogloea sp.]HOY01273.1 AraC family transcriptional regulator [Zoogloea sp.]